MVLLLLDAALTDAAAAVVLISGCSTEPTETNGRLIFFANDGDFAEISWKRRFLKSA